MIGRARELARLQDALGRLPAVLAVTGEPGIGKSRLLHALRDEAAGALVLSGRAAEFERELPYGPLVDALDAHLATLDDTRLRGLDTEQLGGIFPALADRAGATPTLAVERYRSHRAVIELLARLAATKPLVLTLDDMHHADPASLELLLALVRRPPAARVLVAVALRPPAPDGLRDGDALIRIDLGPLDPDEALELIGTALPAAQRDAVLRESGGNPFYIEQLVRAGASLPGGVAEAIAGELRALDAVPRRLLEGAAAAGDPFEPELAAAAADLEEPLAPLDALLAAGLVRATDVPRQFAFRHPLVHRAVYEGAPGGWRLAAHGRVARALAGRGAPPPVLAHHVEFSAQPGDAQAIALLRAAGDMIRPRTPASAARWYEAALRLASGAELDPAVGGEARRAILKDLAQAEAAAGRLEKSRRALLEALVLVDPASPELVTLVTRCAAVEHWLGRHEDARRRLQAALAQHGESQALRLALAFDALYGLDLATSAERARSALDGPDRGASASAEALLALVLAASGQRAAAEQAVEAATGTLDELDDRTVAAHLEAFWYLAWAESFLDRFDASIEHGRRGLELSRATGQDWLLVPLTLASVFPYEMQGRVDDACEAGAAAVDAARLAGNPHYLAWALWEYGLALWYHGDTSGARAAFEESHALANETGRLLLWESEPGWAFGTVLAEEGDVVACRAIQLRWCGGFELRHVMPAEYSIAWDIFVDNALALDDLAEAEDMAARLEAHAPEIRRPLAQVLAHRSRGAVLLAREDADGAAASARAAIAVAEPAGLRLEALRARMLLASALADADRATAVRELRAAEQALDAGGAHLLRDRARRELRRLGHRVDAARRREPAGLEGLSAREHEVVALVAAGHSNPAIAAELFLSVKTVETHLRNVFGKLGVTSRAEAAAAFARAQA